VSNQNQSDLRPLRLEEESLVRALLQRVTGSEHLLGQLESAQVRDMDDGGMVAFSLQEESADLWVAVL
jgi:hypothetical protein